MTRRSMLWLLAALALLTVIGRAAHDTGAAVFAQGTPTADDNVKRDLLALMLAYPDAVSGAERGGDGRLYILMASGERIVYNDGRDKSFEQQLAGADIEDSLAQPYPPDMIRAVPEGNSDPGRVRCYALLCALYGGTRAAVEANLRSVWLGGHYPFNQKNGAAVALEAAAGDISGIIAVQPEVTGYVYPISGTYNYRVIAGTNTLSPHAFGIAVDLKSKPGDYWRSATREQAQRRIESYPEALVSVMESHGFIWGGKWAHFDYLHFEYRPELIIKARADAEKTGGAWHTGFPDDTRTRALIRSIDAALR
jgi:hypothetical protein